MPNVAQVFWRAVTNADYFEVERAPTAGPKGGGGGTYFSIEFGRSLDPAALGAFLGVDPPDAIATGRPVKKIDAAVLSDPKIVAPLEFAPRYRQRKGRGRDRYRIARQNRRKRRGERHPAWMPERGFPAASESIAGRNDPAIPDLSLLKICVLLADDGTYHATFVNRSNRPAVLPVSVDILFTPNADCPPNGVIDLRGDSSSLDDWRATLGETDTTSRDGMPTAPEIEDIVDSIARGAGARGSGQGYRESFEERRAIELHAMALAKEQLEADRWSVEDVSTSRSYDLHCERDSEVLRVEVKGTTGDGSAVLLTPNEVAIARDYYPEIALIIVSGVALQPHDDEIVASGGVLTLLSPWGIDSDGDLIPLGYKYLLSRR